MEKDELDDSSVHQQCGSMSWVGVSRKETIKSAQCLKSGITMQYNTEFCYSSSTVTIWQFKRQR